jgi:hypothetical protein
MAQTRKLMRELEPELLKAMDKEIKSALEPIVARARTLIPSSPPLSGWNKTIHNPNSRRSYSIYGRRTSARKLEWDADQARRDITIRRGGRRARGKTTSAAWQIRSNNPAAAAFELMGRGKSKVAMVRNVENRYPGTGRVLYRAFDTAGGPQIANRVVGIIKKFEQDFNRRLEGASGP